MWPYKSWKPSCKSRRAYFAIKKKYLNISSVKVDLTSSYDNFKKIVPEVDDSVKLNITLANTRARLRMTTLYYFAGLNGYLVSGTGNKVEDFGVGFYTKYGDGGVDLSPIADLLKSEVYKIAAFLKVPESIQKVEPTDGLFGDSRTDEDQIGASYDELEWAMKIKKEQNTIENHSVREKEVLKIYTYLNRLNQHKMQPIPVCEIPKDLM